MMEMSTGCCKMRALLTRVQLHIEGTKCEFTRFTAGVPRARLLPLHLRPLDSLEHLGQLGLSHYGGVEVGLLGRS